MNIKVKKLTETAKLPAYGTDQAAGADIFADISDEQTVSPGGTVMIPCGIALEIPRGYAGFVFARSGLASREGLAPANKVGVIDSDYRGEIMVALHNHSMEKRTVKPGERIAQLVIMPVEQFRFEESPELSDTKRGTGGFGSTGK